MSELCLNTKVYYICIHAVWTTWTQGPQFGQLLNNRDSFSEFRIASRQLRLDNFWTASGQLLNFLDFLNFSRIATISRQLPDSFLTASRQLLDSF